MRDYQTKFSRRVALRASQSPTQTRPGVQGRAKSVPEDTGRPASGFGVCGLCRKLFQGPRPSRMSLAWAHVSDTLLPDCCPACAIAMSASVAGHVSDLVKTRMLATIPCGCGHLADEHFNRWGTCLHVTLKKDGTGVNCGCSLFEIPHPTNPSL
jgi:hypothetical protein